MPPRLGKPTDVPERHSQLIDMLWRFYIAAKGPSTRKIAQVIAGLPDDQRDGTANPETVRRTLGALSLPEWPTVEVIFLALCELADVDPDDHDDGDDGYYPQPPHRELLFRYYHQARYGADLDLPTTRTERAKQIAEQQARRRPVDDPWGAAPPAASGGFADEPPF